jgi:hypothetical protein
MNSLGNFLAKLWMSLFVIFMISGCIVSCGTSKDTAASDTNAKSDTVYVVQQRVDTLWINNSAEIDSLAKRLKQTTDSLVFYRDSVNYENYINARRIEKINYYINLCEKKSTNKKFFYGWIKRTMTE